MALRMQMLVGQSNALAGLNLQDGITMSSVFLNPWSPEDKTQRHYWSPDILFSSTISLSFKFVFSANWQMLELGPDRYIGWKVLVCRRYIGIGIWFTNIHQY